MDLSMVAQVLQARYRHALRVNPVATGLGYRLQGRKDRDRKKRELSRRCNCRDENSAMRRSSSG